MGLATNLRYSSRDSEQVVRGKRESDPCSRLDGAVLEKARTELPVHVRILECSANMPKWM